MAKSTQDPLTKELAQIAKLRPAPPLESLSLEGVEDRIRKGWLSHEKAFKAGLAQAKPRGAALWAMTNQYVAVGLPVRGAGGEPREVDEQAALCAASTLTSGGTGYPTFGDFARRWVESGGLRYALETALRAGEVGCTNLDGRWQTVVLDDAPASTSRHYPAVLALAAELSVLKPAARAELRASVVPLAASTTATGLASLAIAFHDDAWAVEAVARAEHEELSFREPWPPQLFDVLCDGEAFARLLGLGGAWFQFKPASVLGARARVSDDVMADALVRFFAASFAEPSRMLDTWVKHFAAIACAIEHPHVAWLFKTHGKHKWLKKHAALYAQRSPRVSSSVPNARSLEARFAAAEPTPRPAGFTSAELAALKPAARDARLIDRLREGHSGAALVLKVLHEHPSPTVAVALFQKITHRDFATQMPKPGFHRELLENLTSLGKKHVELGVAIAAAKKA